MEDRKTKKLAGNVKDSKKNEKAEKKDLKCEEMNPEDLEKVSGGGNPFANLPRVPEKDIDENLRKNG